MAAPSNTLQTISMITPDAAAILSNNLVLAKRVARDWDDDFGVKGAKIGQTINVRRPARYNIRTGTVVDIQAQTETYSPLTFTVPIGVDTSFTSQELTFSFDDVSKRLVAPAIKRIANQVEAIGMQLINNVYNAVGTPGTALTSSTALDAILNAMVLLQQNDAPIEDGMSSSFNGPAFNAILASNGRTLFNPQKEIGEIYIKGLQGEFGGASHFLSQLVLPHTNGTVAATGDATVTSTPTNPSESQYPLSGSLAVTVGTSGHAPNVGDIFTIAGIYSVNPQTKTSYSTLQQFTVTGVAGSGTAYTWQVSPALNSSGPFQNVSALPAPGAAISMLGGSGVSTQNALVLHRDAFMLANKELELPGGVEFAAYEMDPETGIGIRYVRQFDIRTNQVVDRFDTMVAWATLYEQLAARICTN